MKKRYCLLFFLLLNLSVFAQSDNTGAEFERYSEKQMEAISEVADGKDNKQLLSLLIDWEKKYTNLPADVQNEYSSMAGGAIYYNLACAYSLNKQAGQAIENLKKAVALGYNDKAHIEEDSDLDYIRKDKRFVNLLKSIPRKDTYIEILQKAGAYQQKDTVGLPRFRYMGAYDPLLKRVREYFKLDSVAGNGDEISKIINLLTWVHNVVPHDGNHWTYCEYDAIDLYNYSKTNNQGVNCRMLATILNECYLAMGIKSRFMTCLPMSKEDNECHVINCVYSTTLHKWLWIDPTNNAYWKDEKGVLMSIEEVRQAVIDNRPVFLNDDANWNNKVEKTKKDYLDKYMAKNLYWFQCPVDQVFNTESPYRRVNNTYVALTPAGFDREVGGVVTHDPAYFWQAPENN